MLLICVHEDDCLAPITFAVLIISFVAVSGLLLGSIRFRGISLGPAGVLFAGILFGHFGASIDHEIAEFAKEFGLILFVFTIGLQLGPGIVQLWKQQGLQLNAMALAIVVQGFALVVGFLMLLDLPAFTAAGLFSGATTNTPSLGAAEQAASMVDGATGVGIETLASAYAVAYPGGIIGIIASMLLIRRLFRVDVAVDAKQLADQQKSTHEPIQRRCIVVDNTHLGAVPFGQIPGIEETGVRISRIKRAGEDVVSPATDQTELRQGDVVQVVGPQTGLDRFVPMIGESSDLDLMNASGDVGYRRVFVTDSGVLNRTLRELSLDQYFSVTVTRIIRAGVEISPRGSSRFHYGDIAHIVGDRNSLDRATKYLGNSDKSLKETPFSPLFFGIAVGVLLGMIPISFSGCPFSRPLRSGRRTVDRRNHVQPRRQHRELRLVHSLLGEPRAA